MFCSFNIQTLRFLSLFLSILFFDGVVNGIVFLTSFPGCLSLVHRNTISFCILILYLATSLNSFILVLVVFGDSLGYLTLWFSLIYSFLYFLPFNPHHGKVGIFSFHLSFSLLTLFSNA